MRKGGTSKTQTQRVPRIPLSGPTRRSSRVFFKLPPPDPDPAFWFRQILCVILHSTKNNTQSCRRRPLPSLRPGECSWSGVGLYRALLLVCFPCLGCHLVFFRLSFRSFRRSFQGVCVFFWFFDVFFDFVFQRLTCKQMSHDAMHAHESATRRTSR